MKLVGTSFGDDVDYRAGALSEFSIVVRGLDTEFLQRVRKREGIVNVGLFVQVVAAVKEEVFLIREGAVGTADDGCRECFAGALICSVAFVAGVRYSGNQADQRGSIPAIQGHVEDVRPATDLRKWSIRGVDLGWGR